ncbi:MAG TPA: hypothetical protein VMU22_04770 [Rhizomicrobium sp.]|nr:hypothetical protein [Rhizomicrobium sp.]
MGSLKIAASIAALSLGMTVASANAQQVANVQTCLSVASQVKAALGANTQSPNYEAAMKERNFGLAYCNATFFAKGIDHYNRALALLGATQNADTAAAH